MKIRSFEPQRVAFIDQQLNLLPSIEHLLDVIHHDFLHLTHLLLHRAHFTHRLWVRRAKLQVFLQPRRERFIQRVRDGILRLRRMIARELGLDPIQAREWDVASEL